MSRVSSILIPLALCTNGMVAGFAPPRPAFRVSSMILSRPSMSTPTFLRSTTLERTETSQDTVDTTEAQSQSSLTKELQRNSSTEMIPEQELDSKLFESITLERIETTSQGSDDTTGAQLQQNLSTELMPGQKDESDNKLLEFVGLGTWIAALSSFLLINNYVGPWPGDLIQSVPVQYYGLAHAVAGMLFGGGIILTTFIEWLATASKNASVLKFWFGKVPALDSLVVLPALTASIVSGVGLSVDHYDSLGQAPFHVVSAISTLLAFAIWWASTDLTTQGAANEAITQWANGDTENTDIPRVVQLRKVSNVVSCVFVAAIYAIMVLKPGYSP